MAAVALDGLHLQRHLSSVAAAQLGEIQALSRALQLVDSPDRRFMAWGEDLEFSSRAAFPGALSKRSALLVLRRHLELQSPPEDQDLCLLDGL